MADKDSGESSPSGETSHVNDARANGPWDASEIDDDLERIDLGGLRIRGVSGLEMQVQTDEARSVITLVTLVLGDGAVQVQAFAAPKTSGIWDDVRKQIAGSISGQGGLVEEAEGPFGTELRARVPGQGGALQPARFVGVNGPRWFLRGLFLGSAATPGARTDLEDVFRGLVVVRGGDAMAPGEPLPLRMPTGAPGPEPSEPSEPSGPSDPATA